MGGRNLFFFRPAAELPERKEMVVHCRGQLPQRQPTHDALGREKRSRLVPQIGSNQARISEITFPDTSVSLKGRPWN